MKNEIGIIRNFIAISEYCISEDTITLYFKPTYAYQEFKIKTPEDVAGSNTKIISIVAIPTEKPDFSPPAVDDIPLPEGWSYNRVEAFHGGVKILCNVVIGDYSK